MWPGFEAGDQPTSPLVASDSDRTAEAIKRGEVPHAAVIAEIETMLTEVEQAAAASSLPDEPDLAAAEA